VWGSLELNENDLRSPISNTLFVTSERFFVTFERFFVNTECYTLKNISEIIWYEEKTNH